MATSSVSSSSSSRCRTWRIQLGIFPSGITEAEEQVLWKQECIHYQQLLEQHPFPTSDQDEEDEDEDNDQDGTEKEDPSWQQQQQQLSQAPSLDPLTAMMMEEQTKQERLQELDLQYRKERAGRRRQRHTKGGNSSVIVESEEYDEAAVTLQIIDKDLQRLPPPSSSQQAVSNASRVALLRQVLFVYHCTTHPTPGYRQGMHEIASHLLHAHELEHETTVDAPHETAAAASAHTFALLCAILDPLQPAFDVGVVVTASSPTTATESTCSSTLPSPSVTTPTSPTSSTTTTSAASTIVEKQPLVALGRRVLQWTGRYHPHLILCVQQKVQVPPQLYLTKWIRLLYSRELETARTAVLPLWDAWLELTWEHAAAQQQQQSPIRPNNYWLLHILEAAAVARLLLHAPAILQSDDPLHYLMNVPPQSTQSLDAWQTVTRELLQGKTTLSHVIVAAAPPPPPPPVSSPTTTTRMGAPSVDSATLWSHPLSALTTASSTVHSNAALPATAHPTNPLLDSATNPNHNPFLSSLSAGWKQTLEQAKTKTQSLSKRIYQEWEQAAATAHPPSSTTATTTSSTTAADASSSSPYNMVYRDDPNHGGTPLSDNNNTRTSNHEFHVGSQPNHHQEFVTHNLTIVQSFLTHLEHEQQVSIPATVWQAMADLQQHAVGGPLPGTNTAIRRRRPDTDGRSPPPTVGDPHTASSYLDH